jgi:hypothetical protein
MDVDTAAFSAETYDPNKDCLVGIVSDVDQATFGVNILIPYSCENLQVLLLPSVRPRECAGY